MKAPEAEGIKSLLQLAVSEEAVSTAASGDRMDVEDATPPAVSQRALREQSVPEEDEEVQRKVVSQKQKGDQSQLEAIEVGKDKLLQS